MIIVLQSAIWNLNKANKTVKFTPSHMKAKLISLFFLLLLLHGCGGSNSSSQSGNVASPNVPDHDANSDEVLADAETIAPEEADVGAAITDSIATSENTENSENSENSVDTDSTESQTNPDNLENISTENTAAPTDDEQEPPTTANSESAIENETVNNPPPAPVPLNEIEKAILAAPNLNARFPSKIDHFNFKDDAPGTSVPNVDTPINNSPFNNNLQRISSADKFSIGDTIPTHQYSKRQAWNSNESLIAVGAKVLRTSDFKIVVEGIALSSARNWSHKRPEIMFGFKFNDNILNEFGEYNVAKDQFELIKRFDNFKHCTIGMGEGSISNDDRFVVFTCFNNDNRLSLISFDIEKRTILGSIVPEHEVNWAGISQSGNYILAHEEVSETDRKLVRYNRDFSERYLITTKVHHGDLGIDQYGDDVIVMIGPTRFSYIRLKDKHKVSYPITDSANPTGFGHVSCRNTKRPGWCYVSTYHQARLATIKLDYNGNSTLKADEDGEYSFEGVRVVEAWGIHRSTSSNYHKTPRASASPSGNAMVFSSDWYGSTGANAYVIRLPSDSQ